MLTDDAVHGRVVITSDGLKIGHVNAILVDEADLRIAALQIKLERAAAEKLGMEHSVLRGALIEVPIAHVQSIGDAVLLSVTLAELRPTQPIEVAAPAAPAAP